MRSVQSSAVIQDQERDPLPAGHPATWGLLTNGTCLEGAPYVIPANPLQAKGAGA